MRRERTSGRAEGSALNFFGQDCGVANVSGRDGEDGKGYDKDGYTGKGCGKGKGGDGKGGMWKACFGCVSAIGRGHFGDSLHLQRAE